VVDAALEASPTGLAVISLVEGRYVRANRALAVKLGTLQHRQRGTN